MEGGDRTESGTEVESDAGCQSRRLQGWGRYDPMEGEIELSLEQKSRATQDAKADDPMEGGDRTESGTEVESDAGCQSRRGALTALLRF